MLSPALFPQPLGDLERIDAHIVPPGSFVAFLVELIVMLAAEGDRERVADLTAHGPRLGKADVMGIGGRRPAEKARLGCHEAQMLLVSDTGRLRQGEGALLDPMRAGERHAVPIGAGRVRGVNCVLRLAEFG